MDNTVRIDIEGNLNLRNSTWCGGDSFKVECTKSPILGCKLTLTLQNMD